MNLQHLVFVVQTLLSDDGGGRVCNSTIFGHKNDKWKGGEALHLKREVEATDVGIAHRSLPMGSFVLIQSVKDPSKWVVAQVIDRGPYGALLSEEEVGADDQLCRQLKSGKVWCLKRTKEEAGQWRGCIDMTPAAAKAINHVGYQKVRYWPIKERYAESRARKLPLLQKRNTLVSR